MEFLDQKPNLFFLNIIKLPVEDSFHQWTLEFLKKRAMLIVQLGDLFIFTSEHSFEKVKKEILKERPKDFLYFFTNMTDNVSEKTFSGLLNQTKLRVTDDLYKLISQFKKEEKVTLPPSQEVVDYLLDKILKNGTTSLSKEEIEELNTHSQLVKVKSAALQLSK